MKWILLLCIMLVRQSGVDLVLCIVLLQKCRYCWCAARLCTRLMCTVCVLVPVRNLEVDFSHNINMSGMLVWLAQLYCACEWICCARIKLALIVNIVHANATLLLYLCRHTQWCGRHAQQADLLHDLRAVKMYAIASKTVVKQTPTKKAIRARLKRTTCEQ